jgi:threonyl-tRNA synthetase
MEKVPYMITIGDNEVEAKTVAVRSRKNGDLGSMGIEDLLAKLTEEVETKAK